MKFQKLLSLLLVFCMILSSVTAMTLTGVAEAIAVTDTTTKVVSVNDGTNTTEMTLGEFITAAATSDFSGQTLTLLEDISLVGISDSIPNFAGTLDGNGKTISNLSAPLFATLTGATVKNLTLDGTIELTITAAAAGVLANTTAKSGGKVTIENCTNNVNVTYTNNSATFYIGGFIGLANDSVEMISCVNKGDVKAVSTAKGTGIGGFIGQTITNKDGTISVTLTACINNGAIVADVGALQALNGGLIGQAQNATTMKKCVNNGAVYAVSTTNVAGGGHKMGGLVATYSQAKLTLDACVNYGNVTAFRLAGGLVGQADNALEIKNCINKGTITTGGGSGSVDSYAGGLVSFINSGSNEVVTDSVNYGKVIANKNGNDNVYAGGIVAIAGTVATVKNCINRGELTAETKVGGIVGRMNKADKTIDVLKATPHNRQAEKEG